VRAFTRSAADLDRFPVRPLEIQMTAERWCIDDYARLRYTRGAGPIFVILGWTAYSEKNPFLARMLTELRL
jgi:hypothetical protein